jgi:hypothetical protein
MSEVKIKWLSLENSDASRSLKQHAFKPYVAKEQFTGDPYNGNKSLCSKFWASEDGEHSDDWETLESEPLNQDKACKICVSVASKTKKQPHE